MYKFNIAHSNRLMNAYLLNDRLIMMCINQINYTYIKNPLNPTISVDFCVQ